MARVIRWSPRSVRDLEEICSFIARDSSRYASRFARTIIRIVKGIPSLPFAGRIVPEYQQNDLREKIYGNYRIVYRIKEEVIEIVRIHHSARLLKL